MADNPGLSSGLTSTPEAFVRHVHNLSSSPCQHSTTVKGLAAISCANEDDPGKLGGPDSSVYKALSAVVTADVGINFGIIVRTRGRREAPALLHAQTNP